MGLDEPLWVQYGVFASDLLRGDLGRSMLSREPVITEILARFPATAQLALVTILADRRAGRGAGYRVGALPEPLFRPVHLASRRCLGISLPSYALGLFLIYVFAVRLRWLPAAGGGRAYEYHPARLGPSRSFLSRCSRVSRG